MSFSIAMLNYQRVDPLICIKISTQLGFGSRLHWGRRSQSSQWHTWSHKKCLGNPGIWGWKTHKNPLTTNLFHKLVLLHLNSCSCICFTEWVIIRMPITHSAVTVHCSFLASPWRLPGWLLKKTHVEIPTCVKHLVCFPAESCGYPFVQKHIFVP